MKLRSRVSLAATAAVLVSVIGVSFAVYISLGNELRRQVDMTLHEQGNRVAALPDGALTPPAVALPDTGMSDEAVFTDSYFQVLDQSGSVVTSLGAGRLPDTTASRRTATGSQQAVFEDVTVASDPVRVYSVPTSFGAVRFGRSLAEVDRSLDRLTLALIAFGTIGIATAAVLGRMLASRAIAPVQQLSDSARTIKQTSDLSRRLPVQGRDEVASMAASFNDVLDDLQASQALQRQLVADASHELRTPLTTLRTNIEVLARGHDLPSAERDRILSDVTNQLQDLTDLVGDLIDLARDETTQTPAEQIQLGEVVSDVLERAKRQRPYIVFTMSDERPSVVTASPDRLERAISNLVDNAAKWSQPTGEVHICVSGGTVAVTDYGPGVDPSDLPHIFDRFYRSATARQMPGSGLGLAIVKQIAESLGGNVQANSTLGEGTTLTLRLPSASAPPTDRC